MKTKGSGLNEEAGFRGIEAREDLEVGDGDILRC